MYYMLRLTYGFVFQYTQKDGRRDSCTIVNARLSCWRRRIFSSSLIEDGKYTCWLFTVQTTNLTIQVQHNKMSDFSRESNGCQSEEECGMETWPCRISRSDRPQVALRWMYPVRDTASAIFGLTCTLIFGLLAAWEFLYPSSCDCCSQTDIEDIEQGSEQLDSSNNDSSSDLEEIVLSDNARSPGVQEDSSEPVSRASTTERKKNIPWFTGIGSSWCKKTFSSKKKTTEPTKPKKVWQMTPDEIDRALQR